MGTISMELSSIKQEQVQEILQTWRARVTPVAEHMLEELFHSADQVLLEYADKAESNAIRMKFVDGRKEIWSKKEQLTSVFHENLSEKLFQFTRPAERSTAVAIRRFVPGRVTILGSCLWIPNTLPIDGKRRRRGDPCRAP